MLYSNELVFLKSDRKCNFIYPGENWLLGGKSLYIPNPLTPTTLMFRVYWSELNQYEQSKKDNDFSLEKFSITLIPIQYAVEIQFIFFFIGFPFVLFFYGSGPQLLLFGLIYINIIIMLILVYIKKKYLALSNKEFLMLLFELLACAPFSLNIIRKLTLRLSPNTDPIMIAKEMFDHNIFQRLLDIVSKKIDKHLEFIDEDNKRYLALQSYKDKIHALKE
jgi:hypothetical protein